MCIINKGFVKIDCNMIIIIELIGWKPYPLEALQACVAYSLLYGVLNCSNDICLFSMINTIIRGAGLGC